MTTIKNIFYLDYEKMYSLSSQLFQGLTLESVVAEARQLSDTEKKKSTILDAKELENILTDNFSLSKTVNLHDYNYSKFESELERLDKVLYIPKNYDFSLIKENLNKFIKTKGKILIIDPHSMCDLLVNFKDHSMRLNYMVAHEELSKITEEIISLSILEQTNSVKSQSSKLKAEKKTILDTLQLSGKKIDQEFFSELAKMISFGTGNDIQINQRLCNTNSVTTFLTRELMKTNVDSFVKRYSRKSALEFTLFGMVSQYESEPWDIATITTDAFKNALRNVTDATFNLEATFSSPDSTEIFLDPIALYTEI